MKLILALTLILLASCTGRGFGGDDFSSIRRKLKGVETRNMNTVKVDWINEMINPGDTIIDPLWGKFVVLHTTPSNNQSPEKP